MNLVLVKNARWAVRDWSSFIHRIKQTIFPLYFVLRCNLEYKVILYSQTCTNSSPLISIFTFHQISFWYAYSSCPEITLPRYSFPRQFCRNKGVTLAITVALFNNVEGKYRGKAKQCLQCSIFISVIWFIIHSTSQLDGLCELTHTTHLRPFQFNDMNKIHIGSWW